jgi:hypothetical protein
VLVSVLTPVFNGVARLQRCLESVAKQTHPDLEHIVIDGGSTDGTVRVLEEAGVYFVSEPDAGQTDAINKGFRLARGGLVTWLNADDVLLPRAAETVVATVQADPSVGWVYGACVQREPDGRRWVVRPPKRIRENSFDGGNVLCQPGASLTRSALELVGELDESLGLAMDFDLWLRLVEAGVKAAYVPESLAVFEVHAESKTGSTNPGEFFREEALALLKCGRRRQASFAFGRAAAALGVPPETLEAGTALDQRAVFAGMQVETCERELRARSPRALLRIARPSVWRSREARLRWRHLLRVTLARARRAGAPRLD